MVNHIAVLVIQIMTLSTLSSDFFLAYLPLSSTADFSIFVNRGSVWVQNFVSNVKGGT
jgi:hypothetical protein